MATLLWSKACRANEINTILVIGPQVWVGTANGFGLLDYGATLANSSDDHWMTYTNTTLSVTNISALVLDSNRFCALRLPTTSRMMPIILMTTMCVGSALVLDWKQTPFTLADDQPLVDSWQIDAPRTLAVQGSTLGSDERWVASSELCEFPL